ncbi:MAG TPA: hypothetical protein VGH34_12045 [Vicinamibacterales bacterium]
MIDSGAVQNGPVWRVALLYCCLTFLLAYPLSRHPGTLVLSNGADPNLFRWALGWDTHAFVHQPFSIFDANIFYPQRHTLAYSENFIGSAFFAAPILWLTGNLILATNLVALLSCALCGLGGFVLARKLRLSVPAAIVAGVVFGFSPPRFFRIEQLHLATIQWVPFCLAYLHAYLDTARRRDLHLAVGFFSLQALTSGHGAALLVLAGAIVAVYRVALGEPIGPMRRLRDFGVVGALLILPTLLIIIPYREVQNELQFSRGVNDFITNSASFLASPSRLHGLVLAAFSASHFEDEANAYLFPGYLPLLLSAAAFLGWRARAPVAVRRGFAWMLAAAALEVLTLTAFAVALWISMYGPVRSRWGTTILLSIRTPSRAWAVGAACLILRWMLARRVPFNFTGRLRGFYGAVQPRGDAGSGSIRNRNALVYLLITTAAVWIATGPAGGLWPLVYWLPGLNFIRVPSRFFLLAVLGIAVLAGMGFDRIATGMTDRRRALLAIAASVWLVVEFSALPLGTEAGRVDIPAIDRWLGTQPVPFAIAEVPVVDATRASEYMIHSTAHWQKTVAGYSGIQSGFQGILFRQMQEFPDAASLDTLAGIGVNYIVVHSDYYTPAQRAVLDARIDTFRDRLTLTHVEGAGRVYTLRR